jgi:hypothetical protein
LQNIIKVRFRWNNSGVYLKLGRVSWYFGLWARVLFEEINKKGNKGGAQVERGKVGGLWAKSPSFSPPIQNRGGGG